MIRSVFIFGLLEKVGLMVKVRQHKFNTGNLEIETFSKTRNFCQKIKFLNYFKLFEKAKN